MVDLSRRSAREVLDDHLNLANEWVDTPLDQVLHEDLRRNVSEDIVVLINRGTFRGYDGVRQLAQMLSEELPEHGAFEYTYVAAEGRMGLLEWTYDDSRRPGARWRRFVPDRGRQDRGTNDPLQRGTVRTWLGHGVIGVGRSQQPVGRRERGRRQASRVARAVQPLVVPCGDLPAGAEHADAGQHAIGQVRVQPDALGLGLGEGSWLVPDRVGDSEPAS